MLSQKCVAMTSDARNKGIHYSLHGVLDCQNERHQVYVNLRKMYHPEVYEYSGAVTDVQGYYLLWVCWKLQVEDFTCLNPQSAKRKNK